MINEVAILINGGFENTNVDSLAKLYRAIFFKTLRVNCSTCCYEAFYELREWVKNKTNIKVMAKNKFKIVDEHLIAGQRLVLFYKGLPTGKEYTTENFTDEDAEYLKSIGQGALIESVEVVSKKDDVVKN